MSAHTRKTLLLATDQQQSVLNTLDGNGPRSIAYTPYGHRSPGNGLLSLIGFNGEPPDALTGHYHLGKGYRQFNPVLMRFNSPDSWSPFGAGGLNAYAYCGGDPRNRVDPTGHIWGIGTFFRRILGMKPKPSKAPSSVATGFNSAKENVPVSARKITPLESAPEFDIKFTPDERTQQIAIFDQIESSTIRTLPTKLKPELATQRTSVEELIANKTQELKVHLSTLPNDKLFSELERVQSASKKAGPSSNILIESVLANEIIRRKF